MDTGHKRAGPSWGALHPSPSRSRQAAAPPCTVGVGWGPFLACPHGAWRPAPPPPRGRRPAPCRVAPCLYNGDGARWHQNRRPQCAALKDEQRATTRLPDYLGASPGPPRPRFWAPECHLTKVPLATQVRPPSPGRGASQVTWRKRTAAWEGSRVPTPPPSLGKPPRPGPRSAPLEPPGRGDTKGCSVEAEAHSAQARLGRGQLGPGESRPEVQGHGVPPRGGDRSGEGRRAGP